MLQLTEDPRDVFVGDPIVAGPDVVKLPVSHRDGLRTMPRLSRPRARLADDRVIGLAVTRRVSGSRPRPLIAGFLHDIIRRSHPPVLDRGLERRDRQLAVGDRPRVRRTDGGAEVCPSCEPRL